MATMTRTERNRRLHDEINKDIAYKRGIQKDQSIIYATFEKLKTIDQNYFQKKLEEFDKRHEMEKPYLDKDRSKSMISESIKYEIRRYINELDSIKNSTYTPIIVDEQSEEQVVKIKTEKYKKYYEQLLVIDNAFQERIEMLKKKQSHKMVYSEDIPLTTVQKIRSQDNRDIMLMLSEVLDKIDRGQNQINSTYKKLSTKYRFKFVLWLFPVILVLMIVTAIVPIFI